MPDHRIISNDVRVKPMCTTSERHFDENNKITLILTSFRYRLAPKHTFPTQFHDCYSVVTTVLNTADKYGIDPNRVVVAGDSAGGNLATAIALKLRDENKRLAAQVIKRFKSRDAHTNYPK